VGVAVARNFIGYDPNGATVSGPVVDNDTIQPSLTPGLKVRIVEGGALAGDVYEYVGPTLTDSDPNTTVLDGFDLRAQQYRDPGAWRLVSVGANAAQVRAYIANSSVDAIGALTIDAQSTQSIDAIVVAAAVGVGGGSSTGIAVSAAGAYAENKIKTDIKAYVDGDGANAATDGIGAASVHVRAADASGIDAIAGAAALAAGLGATTGVAVSIGLSLGFNEVGNDVAAFIANADVSTPTGGDVEIAALTLGRHLFDLTGVTAAALDDAATADADNPNDPDPSNTGDDVDNPTDDAVNEAKADVIGDNATRAALRAAFAANGITLATADTLGSESLFTTGSGRMAIDAIVGPNQLQFATPHIFATGDQVVYDNGGGTSIGGLANGVYYVISDGDKLIRLATSKANADAGTAIALAPSSVLGHSLRQLWDLEHGATVKLAAGYANGGQVGGVYQYVGFDRSDVNLATENYTSADWVLADKLKVQTIVAGQSWMVIAPDGKSYVLERDASGTIGVSRNTINAVSVAASLAIGIGGGGAGVAVSGAGAVAQNVILSTTNAYGDNSVIDSGGDVTLRATSTSDISSLVVAASAAIGGGASVGVGASIGIAVARNFIGYDPNGGTFNDAAVDNDTTLPSLTTGLKVRIVDGALEGDVYEYIGPSLTNSNGFDLRSQQQYRNTAAWRLISDAADAGQVRAYLQDSSVQALGDLRLTSVADQTIDSIVIAGSAAVGLGALVGVAVSGSGVFAENTIGVDVRSFIHGDGTAGIHAASVTLTADDTSTIDALAGAVSLAASFGLTAGVAVSIGVSLAFNTIASTVEASIGYADDLSSTVGDITVAADEDVSIRVVSFAASLAAGFGGGAGIGVSGAGAV
jgi:hypothetical protein